jgi:hypothetical protein
MDTDMRPPILHWTTHGGKWESAEIITEDVQLLRHQKVRFEGGPTIEAHSLERDGTGLYIRVKVWDIPGYEMAVMLAELDFVASDLPKTWRTI